MALYFLDYDLRKQRSYQPLYDELARFNAVRMLESSWCFNRFNTTASNLRDHFSQFIDADDGMWVAQVTDWATRRTLRSPNALTTS
ncbi:hypothetical protein [Pseudaquabacterium pictum]|uniref:Uncharacterized protein n=1 Tax=Pseudaquabacterium pictum TaxID=2315236 RepID=A0A480ANJ8_9BURK|nr:hypothetical protein [Rubrivivax pictus]GCL61632.1 hypothetical protein AQPW35_07130 [Rubrivivax pictus]